MKDLLGKQVAVKQLWASRGMQNAKEIITFGILHHVDNHMICVKPELESAIWFNTCSPAFISLQKSI